MQVKFFTIPVCDNGQFETELNQFLKQHKVLDVQTCFNGISGASAWQVCVKYTEGALPVLKNTIGKIDYKEILEPAVFERFSQMRLIRKQLAGIDAVPAYAVFTDEELATLARFPVLDSVKMQTVNGIGDKKIEKYGLRFIELLKQLQNGQTGR